jgi:DUF4097 and DUF4098 domain-containing protein YvlB
MPDTYEFPHDGPIEASVRIGGGDLTVIAEPTSTVSVLVAPGDGSDASRSAAAQATVDFTGDRLRVETPESGPGRFFRRSGQLRVEIRMPVDSHLQAFTGSADVRLDGRLGRVNLHTGSGDTYVAATSGDLIVKSGSGDLVADAVGGELRVNSGSGNVTVRRAGGPVVIVTASGDVDVDDPRGSVTAQTASGDVRLRAVRAGDIKANTASGDVAVGVPIGTRVWLDLNTVSGSTTTNLDMSTAPFEAGAQVTLRLNTVSGDIAVNRVTAPLDDTTSPSTQD